MLMLVAVFVVIGWQGVVAIGAPPAGATGPIPTRLVFTEAPPASVSAGITVFSVAVSAETSTGAVATGDHGSVSLTVKTGPGTLSCATTVGFTKGVAQFGGCTLSTAGAYTLEATDTADPLAGKTLSVTSASVEAVVPGPAAKLAFSVEPPASGAQVEKAFTFTVGVEDASGNLVNSSDDISVAFYDPYPATATLSCTPMTTESATRGVASFSCKTTRSGFFEIIARDVTEPETVSPGYSGYVTVAAGPAVALAFTEEPTNAALGVNVQVEVAEVDAEGNIEGTEHTTAVTLSVTPGTGTAGASLSCTRFGTKTTTVTLTYGANETDCMVSKAGTGYTLTAKNPAGEVPPGVSSAFDVGQEAASIVVTPSPIVLINQSFASFTVTVDLTNTAGAPESGHSVTLFTGEVEGFDIGPSDPQDTNATGVATFTVTCVSPYCTVLLLRVVDTTTGTALGSKAVPVEKLTVPTEGSIGQSQTVRVASVAPGTAVSVGFAAGPHVTVVAAATCTVGSGGSLGYGQCKFEVPTVAGATPPATVTAVVTIGAGKSAQTIRVDYLLEGPASIQLAPTSGRAGTSITISGSGLGRYTEQEMSFYPPGATTTESIQATAHTYCGLSGDGDVGDTATSPCTLTVPAGTATGEATVVDTGTPTARATFEVTQPCGDDPTQAGCSVTGIEIEPVARCAGTCAYTLYQGHTYGLGILATYNDGSSGPLQVALGPTGPTADFVSPPVPAGAMTIEGLATTAGSDVVDVTGYTVTTSPGELEVRYEGFTASASLSVKLEPTCGVSGKPECVLVNGGLLTVRAQVPDTGLLGLTSTPITGVVVHILQKPGQIVSGPCGPGSYVNIGCTPISTFSGTVSLSSARCVTGVNGATTGHAGDCQVTDDVTGPDVVSISPPAGYTVTSVSWSGGSCGAETTPPPVPVCVITPGNFTSGTVTFDLRPYPTLTVKIGGPPLNNTLLATVTTGWFNTAVNGAKVTITPIDGTPGTAVSCTVGGGSFYTVLTNFTLFTSDQAECSKSVPPGKYAVFVGAPLADDNGTAIEFDALPLYASNTNPQPVTLKAGGSTSITFTTNVEPTLTVKIGGPPVTAPAGIGTAWYNTAVDGAKVTITPIDGTPGTAVSCTVVGGSFYTVLTNFTLFTSDQADCSTSVPPGEYAVSVGAPLADDNGAAIEFEGGTLYASNTNPQRLSLKAGDSRTISFTTNWGPAAAHINVELGAIPFS